MPSSDSEGFESADEGHGNIKNRERKRNSSSNCSDKVRSVPDVQKVYPNLNMEKSKSDIQDTEGWDDFDIDTSEVESKPTEKSWPSKNQTPPNSMADSAKTTAGKASHVEDNDWDDFDDWGVNESVESFKTEAQAQTSTADNIKEISDRLAATSSSSSGWGWGWGVDSLLSSASAGITTLTNQVSQGISTVLETGIGAPDPAELARKTTAAKPKERETPVQKEESKSSVFEDTKSSGDAFPFGNLLSGVTKFVETTGTKVIHGGLDTLETIGKKTMEVLQDGDPGLAKKRAMLGLDSGEKPVLSQVLREAKAKAEEEDRLREEKREAKEVHYENLFDDFEGLVHLEALEMLSRQVQMRIEERLRVTEPQQRLDMKETLAQVAELCEMPEEDEEEDESCEDMSKPDALHERLQTATQDLGLKLQFQPLVKQYTDILDWLSNTESDLTSKPIYKRAVSGLAQATALSVEIYHKAGEMLLVKTRRSTADEADALTQMTVVLTKHISELATLFTEKLNSITGEDNDQINTYITNIFLEAGNSSTYIQNAFQLILPILQIGAV